MAARKNRNELLDELRKKRDQLGRNPTLEDILSDSKMSNQSHYRREFGNLRKALEQLDKPTLNRGQIEEQTILKALVAKADNLGRIPSRMEIDCISTVESYKKCLELQENDPLACRVMEKFGDILGGAIATYCAVVDPETVVLGGGVSKAGQPLVDSVEKYFQKYAFTPCKNTPIVLATLGNNAGIYGAARMVIK